MSKTIIDVKHFEFRWSRITRNCCNNSRSDWFSKANTLVWAEPCARWAELKMLSFWAVDVPFSSWISRHHHYVLSEMKGTCFINYQRKKLRLGPRVNLLHALKQRNSKLELRKNIGIK